MVEIVRSSVVGGELVLLLLPVLLLALLLLLLILLLLLPLLLNYQGYYLQDIDNMINRWLKVGLFGINHQAHI